LERIVIVLCIEIKKYILKKNRGVTYSL